jgi:WD40 repeat protein
LWDRDSGRQLACLRGHENSVNTVNWSRDGRLLASGSEDHTARLWDRDSGQELACLRGHEYWVTTLTWSPDGRVLASGSSDKTVRLWDRNSGQELACMRGHKGHVTTLSWSADGLMLRTGDYRGIVLFWHAQTGRCLRAEECEVLPSFFSSPSGTIRYYADNRDGETEFRRASSETPLAWFPMGLNCDTADGLTWAASASSDMYLLRLEGVVEEAGNYPP